MRSEKVQYLIDEGVIEFIDDHKDIIEYAEWFSPRCFNTRFPMRIFPEYNYFRCGKINIRLINQDSTKHTSKDLPNEWSHECLKSFIKIGVTSDLCVNA